MNAICHFFFETSLGQAGISYSPSPFRLTEICLPRPTKADVIAHMKRYRQGAPFSHPDAERAAKQIQAYFNGQPCAIAWHLLDTKHWTPAQAKVYAAVAQIPYGAVRSYGAIAREVGSPRAVRFVGNCMARNPFPVRVPCHRVIAGDGQLGGFGGGLDLKKKMLKLEGVILDSQGRVRMERRSGLSVK